MPVTQRNLKPAPDSEPAKNHKVLKHSLKIHTADFKSLHPVEKTHKDEHVDTPRRRLRTKPKTLPKFSQAYTYSDAYSRFFVEDSGYFPSDRVPELANTYLRANAKFVGEQQSGSARYDIKVELKTVDLMSLVVTGFFQISGLTDEHPLITTCFRGEIINNPLQRSQAYGGGQIDGYMPGTLGSHYSFITEHSNWGSFPKNDMDHWRKLTGSSPTTSEDEFLLRLQSIHSGQLDTQYVYMRWKEEFLLPDLRVKLLKGASFEGFYYIVLNIGAGPNGPSSDTFSSDSIPGTINGLYFHTLSDKFQSLSLRYVEDRGESQAFEFA
ncbi:CIC11C00000003512 [Sungouiella intermedia]|uniref:CIC11C00000003512 n=1 Tax=Sungouiella intermedia TaxID=45354 RepID=A0A1L0BQD0_9ASCO|nr:CIC11C00000003512 [[Candida] intermedia]